MKFIICQTIKQTSENDFVVPTNQFFDFYRSKKFFFSGRVFQIFKKNLILRLFPPLVQLMMIIIIDYHVCFFQGKKIVITFFDFRKTNIPWKMYFFFFFWKGGRSIFFQEKFLHF